LYNVLRKDRDAFVTKIPYSSELKIKNSRLVTSIARVQMHARTCTRLYLSIPVHPHWQPIPAGKVQCWGLLVVLHLAYLRSRNLSENLPRSYYEEKECIRCDREIRFS